MDCRVTTWDMELSEGLRVGARDLCLRKALWPYDRLL